MLHVWKTRPHCKRVLAGKRQRDVCKGQQASPISVSPKKTIIVATIKTQAANIVGKVGNIQVEMLMDSGSSISLLSQDIAKRPSVYPEYGCPSGAQFCSSRPAYCFSDIGN